MKILHRYIAVNLLQGWLLVLLVLGTVFGLIGLIEELDRTQGNYGVNDVMQFTMMTLPTQLLDLSPVIALLGTIVALATLDKNNELTIISCSGVPVSSLLAAIATPVVALMLSLWLLLEYVSAPLYIQAQHMKSSARNDNPEALPRGGVWSKQNNRFIHLEIMRGGKLPGNISLYRFNEQGQLILMLKAKTAEVSENRSWRFKKVRQKQLLDNELKSSNLPEISIDNLWSSNELPTLALQSESMSLTVLYAHINYLKDNAQAYIGREMTFWQRLCLPITVAAMVLLATPISASIGSRRNRNFGINMAIGALIGIFFFLGTQIIYALGQMLQANPIVTALLPAAAVTLCSGWMIRRMHW